MNEYVSDCQRKAVNLLIGDGYEIRLVLPDFTCGVIDRVIFTTEKEIEPGKVAVAYVDIDGLVNCIDPYLYLAGEDYWWKDPEREPPDPPYPDAPEDYALTRQDMEFVERSGSPADALACVRLAAAINSGPPKWITRHLSENVQHDEDNSYSSEGREMVGKTLTWAVNWKMLHRKPGNLLFAELGHVYDSGNPCVVVFFSEMVDGIRIPPARRRYIELFVDESDKIIQIHTGSWSDDLHSCELTGIRPGLTELP